MKKFITYLVAVLAVASYGVPTLVAQAGGTVNSDSSTSAVVTLLPSTQETLDLRVTAYTSLPDETDSTPFITANGTYVHDGIVATNLLPFGTQVEIPSLFGSKIFTVEDRMNKRETNGLDVWMSTKGQALVFGVHNATIVVLQNDDLSLR